MNKFFLIAAILGAVYCDESVNFIDCGHHEINLMKVTGCTHADSVCKIHKQTPVEFEAHFNANQDTESVKLDMFAEVSGLNIPVPGLDTDGCHNHNLTCPIKKGAAQVFKYTFNLPALIPNVKATVTARLLGKTGPLACFKLKGEVVA